MSSPGPRSMSRGALGLGAPPPVRMVHLGLGNFFRAHPAYYTARARDGWGIAAFTGRRAAGPAEALRRQEGLYTLVTRDAAGDRFEVVPTLAAVHAAAEHGAWLDYCARPEVAVITITVTEAGYHRRADGALDTDDAAVQSDIAALQKDRRAPVTTAPARLAAAVMARGEAGARPLAIVPCDNLPSNADVVAAVVRDLAAAVSSEALAAIDGAATFVTTMVDRITPATTDSDRAAVVEHTGWSDSSPVVTEPFHEWVLGGQFPAGRPAWEAAGARFVVDVGPHERRKLLMLNGSHSLLAYAGSIRGHRTVSAAIADPVCAGWVEQWWDEAAPHLDLPAAELADYRASLLERYANPRIAHLLAQIAADGSQKIPVRILPVLRAERAAGRPAQAACRVIAAWICHLRGSGAPVVDADGERWTALAAGPLPAAVPRLLRELGRDLPDDAQLIRIVIATAKELSD